MSSVAEEKRLNPRLGQGKSLEEFTRIMSELQLPYPRKMDLAVPSNFNCGLARAEPRAPASLDRSWAPITLSPAGVPEVPDDWLSAHVSQVAVLDVREPDEFRGDLGHIAGAELLPLQALAVRAAALPREQPVVTVCRSGGRSGKAALSLLGLGFARVASLAGGMTAWNAHGLPVEYGAEPRHPPARQG